MYNADTSQTIWTIFFSSGVNASKSEYSQMAYLFTQFLKTTKASLLYLSFEKSSCQILCVLARSRLWKGSSEKDLSYYMYVLKWATVNITSAFCFEEMVQERILGNLLKIF